MSEYVFDNLVGAKKLRSIDIEELLAQIPAPIANENAPGDIETSSVDEIVSRAKNFGLRIKSGMAAISGC